MKILLDTNVVIRNAVRNDPQHPLVRDALQRLVAQGAELCIAAQNAIEFWVVATRPEAVNGFGLQPADADAELAAMLAAYSLLRDPEDTFERWRELCVRCAVSGRPAHDAHIVAVMLGHGLSSLLTLNPHDFSRYREITVLTPQDV